MASLVTIGIENQPDVNEYFSIQAQIGGSTIQTIDIIFKATRSAIGQCAIGSSAPNTANNLRNALNVDYNASLLYNITRVANTVYITALNEEIEFVLGTNTAAPDVSIVIDNDAITPFTIDSITASQADSNPCSNIKLTVTCSEQADAINSPISQAVASNPFIFTIPRTYGAVAVQMTKDGVNHTLAVAVNQLLESYFDLNVIVDTSGIASLNITPTPGIYSGGSSSLIHLVTPEYSLNNADWQTSTLFTGLTEGDYTLYIRDNLGCSISIDFSVDEFSPNLVDYDPIAEISNINSIRFKRVEEWSDDNPRNVENTLSFEEDTELPNRYFMQLFQKNDGPRKTQVRTNYESVAAKLIDCDGSETSLTVAKVTNNMNITDVRDGLVLYRGGTNQVWFFFMAGSTYDPDTLTENGTYNLNGSKPDFMNVGDYVNLEGFGWAEILETEVVDAGDLPPFNTQLTLIKTSAITAPGFYTNFDEIKITSIYNRLDFERYEFAVDFSALEGHYKVQVDITDSNFGSKQFLSEWLDVRDEHCKTHRIDYYNTEANEINYSTGITHRLRIPYVLKLRWNPNSQQDIYVTDTNTVPLENKYRSFWEFNARPLPTAMAEKLVLALLQDRLFIDGVNYVCEGEPERKTIGSQYQIKANLVKGDYVYDGNNSLSGEVVIADGTLLAIDPSASGFLLVD